MNNSRRIFVHQKMERKQKMGTGNTGKIKGCMAKHSAFDVSPIEKRYNPSGTYAHEQIKTRRETWNRVE